MEAKLYGMICFMCLIITLIEIYQSITSADKSDRWKVFNLSMGAAAITFASDMLYGLYGKALGAGFFAYALNHIYSIFLTLSIYFWFLYSERRQGMRYIKSKWSQILLLIPHLVVIVVLFSGKLYYLDEAGYHRGPLYLVQLSVDFVYIAATGIKAIYLSLRRENYSEKQEYRALAYFLFFPIVFALAQSLTGGGIPMQGVGMVIGYILVFQSHQGQMISRDPLTGLNNRNSFVEYLSRKMENHTMLLHLLILDADRFKRINDTYGHIDGDQALIQIANVVRKAVPDGFMAARFGGDEFVIAGESTNLEEAQVISERIEQLLEESNRSNGKPWDVAVSIGSAVYTTAMRSIPDFIDAADEVLYRIKEEKKSRE